MSLTRSVSGELSAEKDDTISRVTAVAQEEAALLSQFFNRIMLVWAKTAVLLKARV